jgi:hypothetical protein
MQFGVVVVFAILPNSMSWNHTNFRDKVSRLLRLEESRRGKLVSAWSPFDQGQQWVTD